ncbi:hypothetical protein O6H91_16G053200 [Diphasiastrum complanatum]|uniref:Uncharacterized protein n=1 Tax=Diphasiastrum complanatum TaxID=34168 RepID=A0ACC2BCA3_DIPCM|nr:hypothetical protein O6H91_16G053200 [Diphasiastrum complanatum]
MGDQGAQLVLSLGCRCLQLASPLLDSSVAIKQEMAGRGISNPSSPGDRNPHDGPFAGITVCVTGLSKEARKQVKFATERMGGIYSPDLHPQCTHLIVQNFSSPKYEHALKHGLRRGLYVVTLSWFLNSAKRNERLDESRYSAEHAFVNAGTFLERLPEAITIRGTSSSSLQVTHNEGKPISLAQSPTQFHSKLEGDKKKISSLTGFKFYLDPDISRDLKHEVHEAATQEGATFTDDWYLGCGATHVLCEGTSLMKYPWWLLKTVKEGSQHVVQFSSDLARHLAFLLDHAHSSFLIQVEDDSQAPSVQSRCSLAGEDLQAQIQERKKIVNSAKTGVRRRHGAHMQPCRSLPRPITPSSLLETVCWLVSKPTSKAQLYLDSSTDAYLGNGTPKTNERASALWDIYENGAGCDASSSAFSDTEAYTRPMRISEKLETVYKGVFLTILYPIDQNNEMGLSSKIYFSEEGFTRQNLLDCVYAFYQGHLSDDEIQVAIHSDSKYAHKLRMLYAAKKTVEKGYVPMKRSDFLGSRKNFEGLKRTSRKNTGQTYELLLGPC